MFERLYQHANERAVRYAMIIVVFAYVGFGVTWWQTRFVDVYIPGLTSVMAWASAVLVLAFMICPRGRFYRLAGWLSVTTLFARIAQITLNAWGGDVYSSDWSAWSGVITYLFCIALLGRTWDRDVRRWMVREKEGGEC